MQWFKKFGVLLFLFSQQIIALRVITGGVSNGQTLVSELNMLKVLLWLYYRNISFRTTAWKKRAEIFSILFKKSSCK